MTHRMYPTACSMTATLALALGAPLQDSIEGEAFARHGERLLGEALSGDLRGASVAVAIGEEILWEAGQGTIGDRPANAKDAYPAAAWTELLTVATVLHLVEQGDLDLGAEVSHYLPGLDFAGGQVRLRHLLSHSSGISAYEGALPEHGEEPDEGDLWGRVVHLTRYADMLESFDGSALEFRPGTCMVYSNSNVLLAGVLVEAVTARELHEILPDLFFKPLELEATAFKAQEASGTVGPIEASYTSLAGNELVTSVRDLVRWQRSLLDRALLDEPSSDRILGEHRLPTGKVVPYGWGTGHTWLDDHRGLRYGGEAGGAVVHVAYYPSLDLTIACLAEGRMDQVVKLERSLVRHLFDLPSSEVEDRPMDAEALSRYAGEYQLGCNRLALIVAEDRLVLDSALHGRLVLQYQGAHQFQAEKKPEISLLFQVQSGERAHAMVLTHAGVQELAHRLPD